MKTIKFTYYSFLIALLICISGCQRNKPDSGFAYVDATVDDLLGMEFEAILIRNVMDPDKTNFIAIIGDIDNAEKIVQHKIKAEKVVDASWVKRIASGFQNAERVKRGHLDDARAIFLTKTRGYMIKIAADEKVVYGPDYQSEQLWKDFNEIGLLDEYKEPPDMNEALKSLKK